LISLLGCYSFFWCYYFFKEIFFWNFSLLCIVFNT